MLGRFMGVDPVDVRIDDIHSFGRYTYANNSPYVFVDPNGREPHRIINQLFPRGDPFRAAGEAFGAHAAYIAGMVNGDEALKSAAIEGMRENVTTEDGIAAASMLLGGRMGREVPNCAIVCRGGTCTTDLFRTGSGVSTDATTGKLSGISTGVGDSVAAASKNIPHAKVGVTTAGEIRAAGGEVVNDRGNHAEVSGLTAERAADLFKNVQRNPNK
jgi:hypothetical protein